MISVRMQEQLRKDLLDIYGVNEVEYSHSTLSGSIQVDVYLYDADAMDDVEDVLSDYGVADFQDLEPIGQEHVVTYLLR